MCVIALAAVAFSVVVGGFERYTWPPTVAVLLPAVVVLALGWRGPLRPSAVPARRPPLGLAWSLVLVAAGCWELAALLLQPTPAAGLGRPPDGQLPRWTRCSAGHLGRSVTSCSWLALGWFLLAWRPVAIPAAGPGR